MKRLTIKDEEGYKLVLKNAVDCIGEEVNKWSISTSATGTQTVRGCAVDKLAHYEDLEEQTGIEIDKLYASLLDYLENREEITPDGTCFTLLNREKSEKYYKWLQLEEQNKLHILPCAVGDKVFIVVGKDISKQTVKEIFISDKLTIIKTNRRAFNATCFGKTVFIAKEQAEAALKRMEVAE